MYEEMKEIEEKTITVKTVPLDYKLLELRSLDLFTFLSSAWGMV
jgi:hypothetical protein